jgi:putative endonuclease
MKLGGADLLNREEMGRWGEAVARRYLESQAYQVLESNWRTSAGEIDLITQFQGAIVFVEVKSRKGRAFGLPEEAITRSKQDRLVKLAWSYLQQKDWLDREWRIDVIAVEGTPEGGPTRLDHYENAFAPGLDQ